MMVVFSPMLIDDALPIILRQANSGMPAALSLEGEVGFWLRMKALDIFECMIRIDDVARAQSLTGLSPQLDGWALSDPVSLAGRLMREKRAITLAVLLTISPHALGRLSEHLPLTHWMEAARAVNRVSPDQASALRRNPQVEQYLCGKMSTPPRLNLPWVLPLPAPSALRVVQNFRFRRGLMEDSGYREAMRRYIRFFC